jgi:hypothetical protein
VVGLIYAREERGLERNAKKAIGYSMLAACSHFYIRPRVHEPNGSGGARITVEQDGQPSA